MRSVPLQRLLATAADGWGVRFHSGGADVPALLVFGAGAFMPAVALIAESQAHDLLGWTLGAKFEVNASTVFGVQVETQPLQAKLIEGTVLGLMYERAATQLFDLSKGAAVDLHKVYHDFLPAMMKVVERGLPVVEGQRT